MRLFVTHDVHIWVILSTKSVIRKLRKLYLQITKKLKINWGH